MGLFNFLSSVLKNFLVGEPEKELQMELSDTGALYIAEIEKFMPNIYKDSAGKPTIGYGHLLLPGEAEKYKNGITKAEALELFKKDAAIAVEAVRSIQVPLNQNQFDALVSFTFNVGGGWTKKSGLLNLLKAGEYDKVPEKMKEYNKERDKKTKRLVVSRGLTRRRKEEGIRFATIE